MVEELLHASASYDGRQHTGTPGVQLTFSEYVEMVSEPGFYGDSVTLLAACNAYIVNVRVISDYEVRRRFKLGTRELAHRLMLQESGGRGLSHSGFQIVTRTTPNVLDRVSGRGAVRDFDGAERRGCRQRRA